MVDIFGPQGQPVTLKESKKRGQDARPSAWSSHASHSPTYRGPCKRRWIALGWTLTEQHVHTHVRCVVSLRFVFFDKWTKNWLGGSVTHYSYPTALDWILQSQFCRLSYDYHRLFDVQGSPMVHMANKYHQTLRRWSAIVWWLMVPPICCWNALCSPAMCAIQMYAVLWINLWSWVASKTCELPVKSSDRIAFLGA